MKKRIALLSAITIIGTMSLAGCGGGGGGESVDTTKAQLKVLTYDGGVGDAWLNKAARAFEIANKDRTDFEQGKTGVQIHVTKQRIGGDSLIDSDLTHDMYFTENINYYAMTNKGKMADITDVLTTANASDGGKKIIDKIDSNLKSFMNRENKYYAVPFYDCIYGLFYDKDLFMEKSFYMTESGGFTNDESLFGTGPNGVAGDWDDGLPKTYDEFNKLLNRMRQRSVTPFTYSANRNTSGYTARALMSYWSDDEGLDQINLNYTFNGTAKNIVTDIVDGKPVTEEVAITKENGYLLRKQAGLYNALHFADDILCSSPGNYDSGADVVQAQIKFVNNGHSGSGEKKIAMIFEGSWWENEAVTAFNIAKAQDPERTFNYGIMPIPKSSADKIGKDATLLNLNASYGFINSQAQNMKLAKEFFSYLHRDAQLRDFTLETGMTRALDYTIEASEYAHLSSFTKDLIALKQSEHVNLVYPYSNSKFVINNPTVFAADDWPWNAKWEGSELGNNPIMSFIDGTSNADQYFQGHYNYISLEEWNNIIK